MIAGAEFATASEIIEQLELLLVESYNYFFGFIVHTSLHEPISGIYDSRVARFKQEERTRQRRDLGNYKPSHFVSQSVLHWRCILSSIASASHPPMVLFAAAAAIFALLNASGLRRMLRLGQCFVCFMIDDCNTCNTFCQEFDNIYQTSLRCYNSTGFVI